MTRARTCWLLTALAIQGLLGGCATSEVWKEGKFARFHEPVSPLEIRLFSSPQRKDVLVGYLEEREDERSRKWRAYWLYQNVEKVNARNHPRFESFSEAKHLAEVPVYASREAAEGRPRPELYAVLTGRRNEFTLYSGERELGTFELPVYEDSSGLVKQILLTPPALVVDAIAVGCVLFILTLPYSAMAIADAN